VFGGGKEMGSCGVMGTVSREETGTVSRGGIGLGMVACWGIGMVSCGILDVVAVLISVGEGSFTFEVFEPIRRVSRGRNDESWALLQHIWRLEVAFSAVARSG